MLQNEPPGTSTGIQSADVPASQRNVTPQELARALDSLRAKKEEAERRREELSQGPAPEQIWAEVLALRAQDGAASARDAAFSSPQFPLPQASAPLRDRLQKKTLIFVALACAALAAAFMLRAPAHRPASPASRGRTVGPVASPPPFHAGIVTVIAPNAEFYRKLNRSQGPHPQYRLLIRFAWAMPSPNPREGPPDEIVYPLNAVPDGCTFYWPSYVAAGPSVGSSPPNCVFEEIGADPSSARWMMTRYNGRLYQRGWVRRADIGRLKQGHRLSVYPSPWTPEPGRSAPPAPGELIPLTLAVGSYETNCYTGSVPNTFQPCYQSRPDGTVLTLPEGRKVALDGHAWEAFPAFPPRQYRPPAWDKEPGIFVPGRNSGMESAEFDASSQVEPLGAVPNGVPIRCNGFTLVQMLHGYPYTGTLSQVLVDARPNLDRPWRIIKISGKAYLRGWIVDRPARPWPAGRDLMIFSDPDAPEFVNPPVQITVPLDTLKCRTASGGMLLPLGTPQKTSEVIVSNVHLDQHAWDKW